MIIRKCLKVPVHYDTTKSKIYILDGLTARITYGISLISSLVTSDTNFDRHTLRKIAVNGNIASKTGLSAGFVDQCVDKVLWSWKSYTKLHNDWERKIDRAREKLGSASDEKEMSKTQKYIDKLAKREPSEPAFEAKTPCRIDSRTGRIERGKNSFPLWLHVSTLHKRETIDIPLNPSRYHLKQLEDADIKDSEIVKHNKKYYVHISIVKEIPEKQIQLSSIGGIEQGLNRTIAVVLLPQAVVMPHRELICDSSKRDLIDKYDNIIASCQESGATKKLKQLRNKRSNVAIYHDWCLAKLVAEYTEGYYIAIGNASFHQINVRG
jgi:putative transposase